MKLNPYQANVSTEARVEAVPLVGLVEKICFAPLVVLVAASIYHYSLIEDPLLYRKSISIGVEFVALLLSLAIAVIHFARFTSAASTLKFRVRQKWLGHLAPVLLRLEAPVTNLLS